MFNTLFKSIGRRSIITVNVTNLKKKAKDELELSQNDRGERFNFKTYDFTECVESNMHNTKNFFFSI